MAVEEGAVGEVKLRLERDTPVKRDAVQVPPPAPSLSTTVDGPALRPRIEAFGRYRLLAEMGHGGMADVFLAVTVGPAGFSKLQVIKRLRSSFAEDPELQAMLLDEARLAAQLNHRNIVQTIEVGSADEMYFIAMELLDGQPLSRVARRCRTRGAPLPLAFAVKVLSEVLAGLHYAHEARDYEGRPLAVVHRDVSPQNVFVTYDGQVKVMDFGIAKAARRIVETQTGTVRGKIAYMAPEQAAPKTCDLDARADVFSVGVMLWEELAGRRMWAGKGDPEILLALSGDGAPPLPPLPGIPAELARICARATMLNREDRYASAAEMRADLEAWLAGTGAPVALEALGERVAQLFAEDRARMWKIVEQQLANLRKTEIEDPSLWSSTSRAISRDALEAGERASDPPESSTRNRSLARGSRPGDEDPASGQRSRVEATPREVRQPRSRGWVLVAAALLGASAILVLRDHIAGQAPSGAAAQPGPIDEPAPAPPPSGPATAAAPVAPPVDASHIRVRITATPPGARITIDGIPVGANPFEGTFVKDVVMHRILVDAYGFQAHGRMVAFDQDVEITVALRPKVAGTASAPVTAAPINTSLPPLKPR